MFQTQVWNPLAACSPRPPLPRRDHQQGRVPVTPGSSLPSCRPAQKVLSEGPLVPAQPHLFGSNGLIIGAVLHHLPVGQLRIPLLLQGPGEPHPQLQRGGGMSLQGDTRTPPPLWAPCRSLEASPVASCCAGCRPAPGSEASQSGAERQQSCPR